MCAAVATSNIFAAGSSDRLLGGATITLLHLLFSDQFDPQQNALKGKLGLKHKHRPSILIPNVFLLF